MLRGTIRRLIADRGYGFISTEERKDLFFHRSELRGVEFASLREGQLVEFQVERRRDGRLQAVKVRLTQHEGEQHQAHLHPLREDTKINYGRKN